VPGNALCIVQKVLRFAVIGRNVGIFRAHKALSDGAARAVELDFPIRLTGHIAAFRAVVRYRIFHLQSGKRMICAVDPIITAPKLNGKNAMPLRGVFKSINGAVQALLAAKDRRIPHMLLRKQAQKPLLFRKAHRCAGGNIGKVGGAELFGAANQIFVQLRRSGKQAQYFLINRHFGKTSFCYCII